MSTFAISVPVSTPVQDENYEDYEDNEYIEAEEDWWQDYQDQLKEESRWP